MSEQIKETDVKGQCPEIAYFGASYPDATCIDGYLWDLDSDEKVSLTIGGDEPRPFCNTEEFIVQHQDEEYIRGAILKHIEYLRDKYDSKPLLKPI